MAFQDKLSQEASCQLSRKMGGLFEYFWQLISRRITNSFGISQPLLELPPLQIYQQFPTKRMPLRNVSIASLLGVTSLPSSSFCSVGADYTSGVSVSEPNSQTQNVVEDDSVALLLKDTSSSPSASLCSPGADYPFGVSVSEPNSRTKNDTDDTVRELCLFDSSLKSFTAHGYPDSLEALFISRCIDLEFPPPHKFPLLDILCIESSCKSLVYFPLDLFPKLNNLSLRDCPNLVSLSVSEACLPALEHLEIWDCPKLTSFPDAGLPTPNLQSLWLSNCSNLVKLPNNLNSFTHLEFLVLRSCPNLESFPTLSSVMSLSIVSCDKLIPKKEWGLHNLHTLATFEIEGEYPGLETFPEEELLPSNLVCLRVSSLSSLTTLGSGIHHLTALQKLEIHSCPKLHSLSSQCLPFSLYSLSIEKCPQIDTQTLDIKVQFLMERYKQCSLNP